MLSRNRRSLPGPIEFTELFVKSVRGQIGKFGLCSHRGTVNGLHIFLNNAWLKALFAVGVWGGCVGGGGSGDFQYITHALRNHAIM